MGLAIGVFRTKSPELVVVGADWLVAAVLIFSAVAQPIAWHRVVSAGVLLAVGVLAPRLALACRACAAAGLAPMAHVGAASAFACIVFVAATISSWVNGHLTIETGRDSLRDRVQGGGVAGIRGDPACVVVFLMAATAAVGVKQYLAAGVLPPATAPLPGVLACGLGMVAAAVWAAGPRSSRMHGAPLVAAVLVIGAYTAYLLVLPAHMSGYEFNHELRTRDERHATALLSAANTVGAVPLVYDQVVTAAARYPLLLQHLVQLEPTRDEAAALLTVDAALDEGWRPRRAEGRVVQVAAELWDRGRGGEAVRLLRRHARSGEIDALLSLYERNTGGANDWRGGTIGTVLPGDVPLGRTGKMATGGIRTFWVTAAAPLAQLAVHLGGEDWEGPPLATIHLDEGVEHRVLVHNDVQIDLGPVEAGVHAVRINFLNDESGATGDRNLFVLRIVGRE